jgi:hypothetical protein
MFSFEVSTLLTLSFAFMANPAALDNFLNDFADLFGCEVFDLIITKL